MKKSALSLFTVLFGCLVLQTGVARATQTENNLLRIVPAPGPVTMDGTTNGWDLSGGIFACDDVERLKDLFSVWFYAMYDDQNVYLLARFKDQTPLDNTQSSKGGYGFQGDSLQIRFITGYQTDNEEVSHWLGWIDRDKINILSAKHGRDMKGLNLDNALDSGAKQVFKVDADGKGYVQEIAIPWKYLTKDGKPLHAGDSMRMAIEPNFTVTGLWGRLNIHDIFRPGIVLDRVFTFRAYDQWGEADLEKQGHLTPATVRLSDEREFPVKMADGWLQADWTGLIVKHERPGFKAINFDNPAEGLVSLNIDDSNGVVARQLLTANDYDKGPQTVKWDGLTTPRYKTPGNPVPAGNYTWAGVSHPQVKLTLRGWANCDGSTPWENGGTSNWGGDEGAPDAVATDGDKMFLGWQCSEAGKGLLGTDLDGHVVWRVGSGLAILNMMLAVDGKTLFSVGGDGGIVRMRTSDGVFDNWDGYPSASVTPAQIFADKPNPASWPQAPQGMDARDGKLYLAFSGQRFTPGQITDMDAFIAKLGSGDPIDTRITANFTPPVAAQLKACLAKTLPAPQKATMQVVISRTAIMAMNQLLNMTDLAPGTASMSRAARAEANHEFLQANFTGCYAPLQTNFIAICDNKSAKLLKMLPVPFPSAIHFLGNGKLAFISDGSSLLTLDPESGATKPLITGLDNAANFTTDAAGKIYVSVGGTSQQVKIFTPDGQPAGTIGKAGGRQLIGLWQPDGMYCPTALAFDNKNNRLWVTETDSVPKRISVWSVPDGKLVHEFFGPSHYGSSGGAIDPLDPNVMVGIGCEWKLDPATGHASLVGVFDRGTGFGFLGAVHSFAVFCPGSNGKLYLAAARGVGPMQSALTIFERTAPGIYKPRSEWLMDTAAHTTTIWSDVNGDGKKDPDEVTTLPYDVAITGYYGWSANINPADFTIFGTVRGAGGPAAKPGVPGLFRVNPDGFTACGAPKWKLNSIEDLTYAFSPDIVAGSLLPSKDNKYLLAVGAGTFHCFDLENKKQIWTYPNTFPGVQGSHDAPPPVVGLTRGVFGAIGTFNTPQTGTVWVMNGNCGEWYMLNEKGYYLGTLFNGDVMKMHLPDQAVPGADMSSSPGGMGGEDFGGSVTQAPDGKVYIEAGKVAYWNVEATGFDQFASIKGGDIAIAPDDIELAKKQQEEQKQAAVGSLLANVAHAAVTFTGNLAKDFGANAVVHYDKGVETTVTSAAAWTDQTFYVGWDVTDLRPWINGATDSAQMYVSGDTADFQFGSDPKAKVGRTEAVAGDFRLSIGNFQGTPTAVLYRRVSDTKKPREFDSGLIKGYTMEFVDVLAQAKITVTPRPDKKGYVIEAAIPFSALGFTPQPGVKYHGDFGVTYGNEAGSRTRLRVYWSNQETGLVDDAVYELMITPKNWGDIIFAK